MNALAKVPSILGGYRPVVRDDRQMTHRRVMHGRAEVAKQQAKLLKMLTDLAAEEETLDKMREQCGHCDNCAACNG